jgi:WD40 repeat protein
MAASSVGKLAAGALLPGAMVAVLAYAGGAQPLQRETATNAAREAGSLPDKAIVRIEAHQKYAYALAFTQDGNKLVSGSLDGTIRLWNTATGKEERMFAGHRGGVWGLALSPDSKTVLSGGTDGKVLLQEVAPGKERWAFVIDQPPQRPKDFYAQVMQVGMAADGRTALALTYMIDTSEGRVQVLDAATGKARLERSLKFVEFRYGTFSPDGSLLLGCRDWVGGPGVTANDPKAYEAQRGSSVLNIQDIATGREIFSFPLPDFNGLKHRFSPDGRIIVAQTRQIPPSREMRDTSADIRLVELASGKERLTIHVPPEGDGFHLSQLAMSANGRLLAAARGDGIVQLWDVVTGKERLRLRGSKSRARAVAFAPDGRRLASGHDDGTILVWDLTRDISKRPLPPKPEAKTVEQWWTALAGDDAKQAHAAIWGLIAAPEQALPLLRDHLHSATAPPAEKLKQLLADLDSDEFAARSAASKALAEMEKLAEPAMREALKQDIGPEQRRRLEKLLGISLIVRSPEKLRDLRALEVLEQIGTPEARQLLETMAKGAPEARVTRQAKAALERMDRRAGSPTAGE